MSAEHTVSNLCQMQALLLVQNLGAACCLVYVTERSLVGSGDRLVSIAIEPKDVVWDRADVGARDGAEPFASTTSTTSTASATSVMPDGLRSPYGQLRLPVSADYVASRHPLPINHSLSLPIERLTPERSTFPLSRDDEIVGVLVLYRQSVNWSRREQRSIEAVVTTIECAIALHGQNLALRESLERTYLNDLNRQNHLSDLFHQVRNPLAALHVFGKLLDRRLSGNSAALEIVGNIMRESDRLKSLLDDLSWVAKRPSLELAALEGTIDDIGDWGVSAEVVTAERVTEGLTPVRDSVGNPVGNPVSNPPFKRVASRAELDVYDASSQPTQPLLPGSAALADISVGDLLRPIVSVAATMAQARGLTLVTDIRCPEILLRTNVKLMTEALQNLIDNALKYTPEGGHVEIGADVINGVGDIDLANLSHVLSDADRRVEIRIRDTGLGIPPEDLDHVFQRGYRGEKSQTDIQGTGLGLQIVKQIVEQLGAVIAIDSQGRGQGVEVELQLPIAS